MDRFEHELVTLKNGKQYFVLESIMHEYDIYNLVLNVEDEEDVKIVLQEVKNGKTIFSDVSDKEILKVVSPLFKNKIKEAQKNIN